MDRADGLAAARDGAAARAAYEEVAAQSAAARFSDLQVRALTAIGRLASTAGRFDEAGETLQRALGLATATGDHAGASRAANALGVASQAAGRRPEARAWYARAAELAAVGADPRLRAMALRNLGNMEDVPGEAIPILEQSVKSAREAGDRTLEADALGSWGDYLFAAGDLAGAVERLDAAVALYDPQKDREEIATAYTSLGRVHRTHGLPLEAIEYYSKAMELQRAVGDSVGVVQSLNATAVAFAAIPNLEGALSYYEQAHALALETRSPRVIDFTLGNLAGGLLDVGQYARAATMLEELITRTTDSYPGWRRAQLARAYRGLGRLGEARAQADRAVELSAVQPSQELRARYQRALVREAQGDMAGALEDARASLAIIEQTRAKLVPRDFMKQGYSAFFKGAYSTVISLLARQGRAALALETSEQARSRAFLDLLATRELRLRGVSGTELRALASRDPAAAGLGTGEALGTSPGGREVTSTGAWSSIRPEVQSFVAARPMRSEDLTAAATRHRTTIVSYWSARDELFVWVVSPGGAIDVRRVDVTGARLASLVAAALPGGSGDRAAGSATLARSTADSRQVLRELYGLLIAPVRDLLPRHGSRLTIIPDGPLMRLPFAALANERGRYLVEGYALNYVPAGALLDFTATWREAAPAHRSYLFVADPALPPGRAGERALPPLPGARSEVRAISRLVPAGDATVLEGGRATRAAVTTAMSRASVLHFATHQVLDDTTPLESYLALGTPPGDAGDGRLAAQDLYGLDLHAELIVLSACRSAGGVVTGEGISALARALFYAGTPSIVASVWDVADQTSGRLLTTFYAGWLRGGHVAESMRAAQLRLIGDLRAGRVLASTAAGEVVVPEHPAFWAGFLVLGEP